MVKLASKRLRSLEWCKAGIVVCGYTCQLLIHPYSSRSTDNYMSVQVLFTGRKLSSIGSGPEI